LTWYLARVETPIWLARPPYLNSAGRLGYSLAVADGWLIALLTAVERHMGAKVDRAEDWASVQETAARSHAWRAVVALEGARTGAAVIRERGGVYPEPSAEAQEYPIPPPAWDPESFNQLLVFVQRQEGFESALLEFASLES
jgi:hypothetical protein